MFSYHDKKYEYEYEFIISFFYSFYGKLKRLGYFLYLVWVGKKFGT